LIYAFLFLLLTIFPPDSLNFVDSFGKFQRASAVSTSREEFIFVTDNQTNQIHKYSENGKELIVFGGSGFGNDQLNMPMAIDATNGLDVYVCDYQNNRIQRYDIKLNFIASFNFNTYNLTSDNSQKIYYPYGIAFLNTSEIFILADASTYKVVKLKALDEVSLLFGSSSTGFEKIVDPGKVVRGANLDVWILDKSVDALLDFDNYGTFVKKIQNPETNPIISMAYYKNNLYILNSRSLIIYDLKANKFSNYYGYPISGKDLVDIAVLKEDTVLLLAKDQVYKFTINNIN